MTGFDLPPTLSQALALMRAGETNPLELTQSCLRQIERLNPQLNAFITVCTESCDGFPLAVKDIFETKDILTTAGTPFYKSNIPTRDAFVIQKLKQAGAGIIGKTNTHEIALGVTGINPHYGPSRNPHDPARITGGSSGGSAAAVAAGMCLGALGSDTGGSIRIPAALCGVVGMKPTYGRVSTRGVLPLSWNLDHVGPIARSVEDADILLHMIAGYDPLDPASLDSPAMEFTTRGSIKGWRVALAAGDYVEDVEPGVEQRFEDAARGFTALGAILEKVDVSYLAEAAQFTGRMIVADAAAFHRERLAQHPEWFGVDVRQRLEMGRDLRGTDYALARRAQSELRRRMEAFFKEYDILLLPTVPVLAPRVAGTDSVAQARSLNKFTAPFNLAGLPALSVPCGEVGGLPVGLQIVSAPWREDKVLRAGAAFERA